MQIANVFRWDTSFVLRGNDLGRVAVDRSVQVLLRKKAPGVVGPLGLFVSGLRRVQSAAGLSSLVDQAGTAWPAAAAGWLEAARVSRWTK